MDHVSRKSLEEAIVPVLRRVDNEMGNAHSRASIGPFLRSIISQVMYYADRGDEKGIFEELVSYSKMTQPLEGNTLQVIVANKKRLLQRDGISAIALNCGLKEELDTEVAKLTSGFERS